MPEQPEPLLTLEEAARRANVPLMTAQRWPSRGGGPICLKVGRHVRIRESDFTAWLDSCVIPAAKPRATDATASD